MGSKMNVGVIGAGTMGSGIAQIAAQAGHSVRILDTQQEALDRSRKALEVVLARLVEKGKLTADETAAITGRISYATNLSAFADRELVIEAIVENLGVKQKIFNSLEKIVGAGAIMASNTSSLSITAIAGALAHPERMIGLHFFNPAPLLPLVEVIPGMATEASLVDRSVALMNEWGKVPVVAKDTPGFIVNRVARPFYGEALRIYEEGLADMATIDHAMRTIGGFRMGPFELMDLIGNDVNFAVTKSVFEAFFYDPRYRPSFTQQRMVEAGWLGRKSGRGYFNYAEGAVPPNADPDVILHENICWRILVMLINEAVDACSLNIASAKDLDLAMTKGVNYPKGLLQWADEKGLGHCLETLERLQAEYGEDRYRPSPLLRRMVREGRNFFEQVG